MRGKPYFLFPDVLKRWSFEKKTRWTMIFLVLSGKMIFLFPKNMILPLRQKMKDDLSQKNTWKCDIFFRCSEKMVFSKRIVLGHDLSCIIWKDGIFFSANMIFFPWEQSEGQSFSRNTWKYAASCVHVRVLQTCRHAILPKKSRMVLSRKNTTKGD